MTASTNKRPAVSVVMSVYNGGDALAATVDSILQQTFKDFEFLIVDDGSTDNSAEVLRAYQSKDPRVRIIEQKSQGLTIALNNGCQEAAGEFIARQDVGDVSLPNRLEIQLRAFDDPRVHAVGVAANRIGPSGENLGTLVRDLSPEQVTKALHDHGTGLMHAAAVFRAASFREIGAYRPQFKFAQDTDLWYRLSRLGLIAELPDVLFNVLIEAKGISGLQTERQIKLAALARESYLKQVEGESDEACLAEATRVSQETHRVSARERSRAQAHAHYYIGGLLLDRGDRRCRKYFAKSMFSPSTVVKSIIKYCVSFARTPQKIAD